MNRLSPVITLLILEACSSSSPPSSRMDDGKPLPILLTQHSATDTTVVLAGDPPVDPMDDTNYTKPQEVPIPLLMITPPYPETLRLKGIEGTVWMKLLVTPQGAVSQARIFRSTHDGFNRTALRAAIRWKYVPDHVGDSAISSWVTLPMRFRLNK